MRYRSKRLYFALALVMLAPAAFATGSTAPWTKEWIDSVNGTTGSMAVDGAGACHVVYFTNGDTGAARWSVRIAPNTWINPLTGSQWNETTIYDNLHGMVRPSVAFDPNRNAYIAYETSWAGPIALVKYNYVGGNRWVQDSSPVMIPNAAGYSPRVHISPNGYIGIAWHGGHDDVRTFPPGISVNTTGNYRSGWSSSVGWDYSDDFIFDNQGNIHLLSNGDYGSGGDPYAVLFLPYYYKKYSPSMNLLAGPVLVCNPGETRVFRVSLAIDGNTIYAALRIAGYLGMNNCWVWTINGTTVQGPYNWTGLGADWTVSDCNISAENGYIALIYLAAPNGVSGVVYAYDFTRDLRSGPLDPGIRSTNVAGVVDSRGNIYANARVADTWIGGTRFGMIPGPTPLGTVAGTVTDSGSGQPIGAATVTIAGGGGYYRSTTTAMDGTYSIGAIFPGSYTVTATKLGYTWQAANNVAVSSDQTSTVNFSIAQNQGTVTGHVYGGDGAPLAGASVTAVGPGTYTVDSGPDGSYTLAGVAVGSYTVTADKFGYAATSAPMVIGSNGEAVSRDFTITKVSIGDVKQVVDWATVELADKVVTGVFATDGCFYIEDPDRCSGVRVTGSTTGLAVGDMVNVAGQIFTRVLSGYAAERQISNATTTKVGSGPLEPVAMTCRAVGGGPAGSLAPGVKDGIGINSVGLLVRITGRVTFKSGQYIYVDDGSNVENLFGLSTPEVGVMVKCPSSTVPANVSNTVSVTGIVQGSIPANAAWTTNRRYVQMRDWQDLRVW